MRRNPALSPHLLYHTFSPTLYESDSHGYWNEMGLQRFWERYLFPDSDCIYRRRAKEMAKGRKYPLAEMERKRNSSAWLETLLFKRRSLCSFISILHLLLQRWLIAVVKGHFQTVFQTSSDQPWTCRNQISRVC